MHRPAKQLYIVEITGTASLRSMGEANENLMEMQENVMTY